ncbi:GIY-YIG nuclease family protein [Blastococcus sp. TF02A_35]|uniref:GIY-YIG nuclease family protein n=1 Tax=Blastococcus sp. TF02A-35 TaxID=2559612 RepID=UPI001074280A|nr:GIY-YIG nuclease family protein [Blastococcus sp. TF02A_35]TFV47789.1 GIY-YIG nuclease family protein [Blastococcus sp. TF02A_35]
MDDALDQLVRPPVPLPSAALPPGEGGVPAEPGLYAWWAPAGAVPGIPGPAHPHALLELLYVGIAPSRTTSRSTLRSRVLGNHAGGNTGSSTLRRSLAALLTGSQGYRTRWTSRTVLEPADEQRLSAWMREHLSLTWAVHPAPWEVEAGVIERLAPPLNQADNAAHPLHAVVREARARWTASARP